MRDMILRRGAPYMARAIACGRDDPPLPPSHPLFALGLRAMRAFALVRQPALRFQMFARLTLKRAVEVDLPATRATPQAKLRAAPSAVYGGEDLG